MAELADAQDLGSCGDSVWVQVPLPAPRRSKLRCTASTGTAERLCLLTFVPLRLFILSNPDPLCWAPDLFLYGIRFVPTSFFAKQKKAVIHFVTSVPPFKIEPAALGFNFVFWIARFGFLLLSKRDLKPEAVGFGFAFRVYLASSFLQRPVSRNSRRLSKVTEWMPRTAVAV